MTEFTPVQAPASAASPSLPPAGARRWPRLRRGATRLADAFDRRPPAAITICVTATVVGLTSAQVAGVMWQDGGQASEGIIYVALFAVQAVIAIVAITYVLAIWIRLPDLPREAARKALGGVVKWEAGWFFMVIVTTLATSLARSTKFTWASLDTTLLSLIMVALVVSGVGDTYVNWPFTPRAKETSDSRPSLTVAKPPTSSPQENDNGQTDARPE